MNRTMMQAAFAVLELLEPISPDSWWLETYCNGREQGFNIWVSGLDRRVSFSRDRSSDDITVYTGRYQDFGGAGNTYNVKPYTYINTFFFQTPREAANFIFNYLTDFGEALDATTAQDR